MPATRFDKYDATIAKLAEEHDTAAEVWRQFEHLAAEKGWTDIPAERTVKRRVGEFQKLPKIERSLNVRFKWPDSMQNGTVPWEASHEALGLLRWRDESGLGRPTNREAIWYWRLWRASPSITAERASTMAALLSVVEFLEGAGGDVVERHLEPIEWQLAYEPWGNAANAEAYVGAVERAREPIAANPIPANAGWTFETFAKDMAQFFDADQRTAGDLTP
jgi:hypothetical protein